MGKRGPKSAEQLLIASPTDAIQIVERQRPSHDLTDEEVEVWHAVVSTVPADWFDKGTAPLLTQYCRHVVQARRLAELIEKATSDADLQITDYDRLLKMQQRESGAISSLATKMRISQQATTNHRGNKQTPESRKPWEFRGRQA
jgi:hypothetical protein